VEFARTCSAAKPFASVYRFVARDGRVVWVHGHAKLVRDADGRPGRDAVVELFTASGLALGTTRADADGAFRMVGVRGERHQVFAELARPGAASLRASRVTVQSASAPGSRTSTILLAPSSS